MQWATMLPPPAAAASTIESRVPFRRFPRGWRVVAALFFVAMLATARAGTPADLDRDNGLPDAQLGTPLKSFQGLQQTENTGRWLTYVRPTDKLEYAGHTVKSITYNFFKERLYSIFVELEGGGNVKGVRKSLEKKYGKETSYELHTYGKTATQVEIREWAGTRAYCVYKNATDFKGGVLTFLDKPIWDTLQVPKRERDAQTRDMLKGSYLNGDF